jgi:hypothetical protein
MNTNDGVWLTLARERGGETARVAPGRVFNVGRAADADLVIDDDPHVSAMHFRLHYRDSEWWLEDLGSRNGTFVNGVPVRQTALHHHDQVVAGDTSFRIRISAELNVEPPPAADNPAVEAAAVGQIVNDTAFSIGTVYSEDGRGASISIVVKATWTIADRPVLAADQWPIFMTDRLAADDPLSSVRFESDLVPFKPLGDVVLVGCAHPPGGQPVTHLSVGLRVGRITSLLAVFGDRTWQWRGNGTPVASAPEPFREMDLVYERAFGGIDVLGAGYYPYNVEGVGFIAQCARESVEAVRLPNLEDPQNLITSWETRPKPMATGFYGRAWMPRVRYAGKYEQPSPNPQPWPPPNFSERFYNGAHPDLQVEGYLSGDEPVTLLNVCPDRPDVRFQLPARFPKITIVNDSPGSNSARAPLVPVLDTVVFVPDAGIFYEVFRSRVTVPSLDDPNIARILIAD